MFAFALSAPGIGSYGSTPAIDTVTKSIDSNTPDRIGELQKFLLASDWSSLSSLSPPTAPIHAVTGESNAWSSSAATAPLFPSSVDTVKPTMHNNVVINTTAPVPDTTEVATDASNSVIGAVVPSVTPFTAARPAYPSPLTPPHRNSFDTCYSDSVGSPDSERDFLTSPSLFDDADFEFDGDALANFPLFPEHAFEDPIDAHADDTVSAFASNLENVKLEADEHDSQTSDTDFEASQSTVMPSQSQVKVEEQDAHHSLSTLDDAFKTEHEPTKLEPKHEEELVPAEDIKPYFSDEEAKAAMLSTLANVFGHHLAEPVKELVGPQDEQQASNVGPVRSNRGHRERRSSPTKANNTPSVSASPAPIIDPITKAKRWQCLECGKWFDRAYNLKTHRYTHEDPETRARPFICPDAECQKQFARKHDMQRHFENVHRGESRRARGGSVKRSRADDLG